MKQYGNLRNYCSEREQFLVDEDGVLQVKKHEGLQVFVPLLMVTKVRSHVHGLALVDHCQKQRTIARLN